MVALEVREEGESFDRIAFAKHSFLSILLPYLNNNNKLNNNLINNNNNNNKLKLNIISVIWEVNNHMGSTAGIAEKCETLFGSNTIEETLCGKKYFIFIFIFIFNYLFI